MERLSMDGDASGLGRSGPGMGRNGVGAFGICRCDGALCLRWPDLLGLQYVVGPIRPHQPATQTHFIASGA